MRHDHFLTNAKFNRTKGYQFERYAPECRPEVVNDMAQRDITPIGWLVICGVCFIALEIALAIYDSILVGVL